MMFKLVHTPYTKKQIGEHVVASLATNIIFKANYVSVESQNDPTPHEHAI
jgi:hypothetical protein